MELSRELLAIARLDLAEVLRARWLVFCGALYGVLAAIFVLVGLRESSVLGFTGMGRVLLSLCHALVLILPLLALSATGQVVNRARDDGTLELLFTLPVRRSAYFGAVTLTRYLALTVPFVVLLLGMAALGRVVFHDVVPWAFLLRATVVGASLLLAFVGLGVAISTWIRDPAKATIALLIAWACGAALLDFALVGAMLQWRLQPQAVFLLAGLNPVEAARLALLSGIEPELSSLGPVGFYLATRLGPTALFVIGTAWPALFGVGLWLAALRGFRRGDIV